MRRILPLGICLVLLTLFTGCSVRGQGTKASGTAPAPPARPVIKHTDFPDLVLPTGMDMVEDKTLVVKTGSFVGGVITLRGRVTAESVVTFFEKQLLARGWEQVGSIRYKNTLLLAFKRPNGSCFVYIKGASLGQTEVKIWASEVLNGSNRPLPGTVYP